MMKHLSPQFVLRPVVVVPLPFDRVAALGKFSCSQRTKPVTFNLSDTNI